MILQLADVLTPWQMHALAIFSSYVVTGFNWQCLPSGLEKSHPRLLPAARYSWLLYTKTNWWVFLGLHTQTLTLYAWFVWTLTHAHSSHCFPCFMFSFLTTDGGGLMSCRAYRWMRRGSSGGSCSNCVCKCLCWLDWVSYYPKKKTHTPSLIFFPSLLPV